MAVPHPYPVPAFHPRGALPSRPIRARAPASPGLRNGRAFALALGLLLAAAWYAPKALAMPLSVTNAGFEDIAGETVVNEFTFGALNGWDLYDPDGVTSGGDGPTYFIGTLTPFEPDPVGAPGVHAFFPAGAPEGERVGIAFNFFNGSHSTGNPAAVGEYGLVQTLGDVLMANTTYTLEVEVGNIASGISLSNDFFDLDGFPGYRIDLLAGGEVIAQDVNGLAGSIAEGTFATSTVSFSTGATHARLGEALGIRLVNLNQVDPTAPTADLEVDFDNVRLSATTVAVPTPSTFALGLIALVLLRRLGTTRVATTAGD